MGRGIAYSSRKPFPRTSRLTPRACERDEVQPGRMFVYESEKMTSPRYIINFPTKRHWRGRSRIEDIESGLEALAREIEKRGIRSIAIPPLGTNLGKTAMADVRPRIEEALGRLEGVTTILFEPGGGPVDDRPNRSTKAPNMTRGRAALLILMDRYVRGLLDPFVTLLEVHKLMYFMQEAGEYLQLKFAKWHYGPYAVNFDTCLIAWRIITLLVMMMASTRRARSCSCFQERLVRRMYSQKIPADTGTTGASVRARGWV